MKRIKWKMVLVFFLIIQAQDFYAQLTDFRIVQYDKNDGLTSEEVLDFVMDDFGYLWIATTNGLERFDGSTFERFAGSTNPLMDITGKEFNCLFKDSEGLIWAGSEKNGVIVIDPKTYKVQDFVYNGNSDSNFPGTKVKTIFEDDKKQLWVAVTRYGLSKFNRKDSTFTTVKTFTDEKALKASNSFQLNFQKSVQDNEQSEIIWLATGAGLCRFNTTTNQSIYFAPPKDKEGKEVFFIDILIDKKGIIWLTTWTNGLFKFDKEKSNFEKVHCSFDNSTSHQSNCNIFQGMTALNNDEMLLHTKKQGLWIFNKTTSILSKPPESAFNTYFSKSFTDKNNNIWLGSGYLGKGFYCIKRHNKFQKIHLEGRIIKAVKHPLRPEIFAISIQGDLFRLDTNFQIIGQYRVQNPIRPKQDYFADIGFDRNNQLWILGSYDLYYWDDVKASIKAVEWSQWIEKRSKFGYYWKLIFDKNNQLWISAQSGGLAQINQTTHTVTLHNYEEGNPHSLKNNYSIGTLYLDSLNNIWGWGEGMFYYSNRDKHFVNYPHPLAASDGKKPLSDIARFVSLTADKMWISSALDRVGTINISDDLHQPWEIVTPDLNLPSVRVNSNVIDKNGDIWMSSKLGLTRINPNTGHTVHFGKSYGLENLYYLSTDKNGLIYVGTSNGFYQIHPDAITFSSPLPKPIITNFNIFDKAYASGKNPATIKNVKLSYKQNFFSFNFAALDFESKSKKQFAYMLEGLDKDWIYSKNRSYVGYTNLDGGDYTFKVKARNPDSQWSDKFAQIKIHITPPFWKTWWFWLLMVLFFMGIAYSIHLTKISQIRKEEKLKTAFNKQLAEVEMKALRAQMNPHFLFNSLNAIKLYVLKRDKEKAADYLTDFAKLIRLILKNSAQKRIPLSQEIETLKLYIAIEKMRFDEGFEFSFHFDEQLNTDNYHVPPLIFQPYVENAIWHGLMHKKNGIGQLNIYFEKISKGGFQCIIEDNGIGRKAAAKAKSKTAQKRKSMGMNITRNRMNMDSIENDYVYAVEVIDLYDLNNNSSGTKVIIDMIPKTKN